MLSSTLSVVVIFLSSICSAAATHESFGRLPSRAFGAHREAGEDIGLCGIGDVVWSATAYAGRRGLLMGEPTNSPRASDREHALGVLAGFSEGLNRGDQVVAVRILASPRDRGRLPLRAFPEEVGVEAWNRWRPSPLGWRRSRVLGPCLGPTTARAFRTWSAKP